MAFFLQEESGFKFTHMCMNVGEGETKWDCKGDYSHKSRKRLEYWVGNTWIKHQESSDG